MDNIIEELVEYSGKLFIIREDVNLPMPAFSLIEYDFRNTPRNVIIINKKFIPNDISIMAHILAHEYGHHIYNHVSINPSLLNVEQIEQIECEADFYAYMFIEKYKYNKNSITKFIIETTQMSNIFLKKRLNVINGDIIDLYDNIDLIKF